ncbi:hypothetical protein N4R57_04150 [Rhodobacteraceae bacterium D3-12]|nr:hypothetical protein N4R57_04150 [Rhodobacteraceae bacterium D3-12]
MTYTLVPASDAVSASADRAGSQARSDITALADGGAMVVYTQTTQPDPDVYSFLYEMFAQRYDADGVAMGAPVSIEQTDDSSSMYPVVTGLADGGYAVGWRDSVTRDAHVRSYDADGAMRGETIIDLPDRDVGQLAEVTADGDLYAITALDTGGFAFTWNASYPGILAQYGGAQIVYTQTFTDTAAANGTPSAITPWVGTGSYSVDYSNWVGESVSLPGGRYIVFMRGGIDAAGNTSDQPAILGRVFDQSGNALGDSFMISSDAPDWEARPAATAMPDGGFVVTWYNGDVSAWRRFDADGVAVTDDIDLDARYYDTAAAAMEDGGVLITARYISSGSVGYTTYAQRYDENNEAVGEMFVATSRRVPDYEINYYHSPLDMVTLGNGKIMALIEGSAFSDELGNDVLVRLYLPDSLGTSGEDELIAAEGGTAIFGRDGDDLLQGAGAADYLDGEVGNDTITGGDGGDTLIGGEGDDSLTGGDGDDFVNAGPGNDSMIGGAGNDTAAFDVRIADITSVRGPSDALTISYAGSSDVVQGFEVFEFSDGSYTDTRTYAEILELRNIYEYGTVDDDTIVGDYGQDTLIGSYGDDDIFGEAGDDSIDGRDGDDQLYGGIGNDTLDGGKHNDELYGEAGDDVLYAGFGDDTLDGGDGNDRAIFNAFPIADLVVGGPDDALTIDYDNSYYNPQHNVVSNVETYEFQNYSDPVVVLSYAEILELRNRDITGTVDDDTLPGNYGDDTISGLAGNDMLLGGEGDDRLIGGADNDDLQGGGGSDTAVIGASLSSGGSLSAELYHVPNGLAVATSDGTDIIHDDVEFIEFSDQTISYDDLADLAPPTFTGTDNADLQTGTPAAERFNAMGGNDWMNVGGGSDTIDGGDGRDMVSFYNLADTPGRTNVDYRLDIDMQAGTAVNHDGSEQIAFSNVERITTTIYADRIRGTDGDDEIRALGNYDWIIATEGNDTIDGGSGQDMISFLEYQSSEVTVVADVFSANGLPPSGALATGVVIDLANSANNTALAEGLTLTSVERITGSSRQDVFYGDDGENDFRGLGGYDWFVSSTGGRERYYGGSGTDTVTYYNASSGVTANLSNGAVTNGRETGYGSVGDARSDLYVEIENLVGSRFDDELRGSSERNQLSGLEGDDFLFGYGGVDYLMGGLGNDVIDGGGGSDYALFTGNAADYTLTRSGNNVTVVGADGTDQLIDVEYFRFDDGDVTIWDLRSAIQHQTAGV